MWIHDKNHEKLFLIPKEENLNIENFMLIILIIAAVLSEIVIVMGSYS